jgi:predicted DNA-binding protein
MKKEKNMIIRMPEELLSEYKELCEEQGYSMSKRVRKYILNEIKEIKNEKVKKNN